MSAALPRGGALAEGVHHFPLRVYYEDTDAGGVVYYANYLKFAERARTEMMRALGIEHQRQRAETGLVFVVRRVSVDFLAPARLDDELVVETRLLHFSGASLALSQDVRREATPLARLTLSIACVGANGRPARLPPPVKAALFSLNPSNARMVAAHAR